MTNECQSCDAFVSDTLKKFNDGRCPQCGSTAVTEVTTNV